MAAAREKQREAAQMAEPRGQSYPARGEASPRAAARRRPVHRVMRPVAMKSLPRRLEKLEVAFCVHFALTRGAEEEPLDGGKL